MAGLLAKKLYNIPFVLTTHSLEPLRAWKAEQLGSGYVMSSWMERTAILDADAVIAVSQGTRADILRAYPEINPNRIHVIYNGIDLQEYQKTTRNAALVEYGVDPSRPYVLFVGRITRQKGVTHLVDAIPHLPPQTQVVLCAGAPDTPGDRSRDARENRPPSALSIRGSYGSRRCSPSPRPSSSTATAASSAAHPSMSLRHHQSRGHGLPARLSSPAPPAVSSEVVVDGVTGLPGSV